MKNSVTLPVSIVHFRNLDTQVPQVGPSFLGVKIERPAIAQPRQGIEHCALSSRYQVFALAPIAPHICLLRQVKFSQYLPTICNIFNRVKCWIAA